MMVSPPRPTAPRFALASGTRVLDRFTIQRGLGTGGFGEVYFAISDAGKEVALKRVQRHLEIELRGVAHCLNLKHPNLVALYDVCRDALDDWWVVMEFVAGSNLRQRLDERPSGLDDDEVRRWFSAAAKGVGHLHQQGLVHRDLKPANLFDDVGVVKVGDYGLSKFISDSRRAGQTESVGTFHYMAPEIGRGEYGREIDIYALGVILYEMLTGRPPFDGETAHEIIIKHLSASADLNGIAQPYQGILSRALHKDPKQRWQSTAEMLQPLAVAAPVTPDRPLASGTPRRAAQANQPRTAAAAAAAPPASAAPGAAGEPFAEAIGEGWNNLRCWWRDIQLSAPARWAILLVVFMLLVRNLRWLFPIVTLVGFVYVPYYIIRQMLIAREQRRSASRLAGGIDSWFDDPAARYPGGRPRGFVRISRAKWRRMKRAELATKRVSTQLAELSGSWLAGLITVGFCGVAIGVIGLRAGDVGAVALAPYGWAMTVALAVTCVLLAFGKLWESREADPLNRRLALAGCGGLLGLLAGGLMTFLMIPQATGIERTIDVTALPQALYVADGTPRIPAWIAHFALLLGGLRWWNLTDPLRPSRLAVWPVLVAVVFQWLLHQLVPLPQPWGMIMAGVTAVAVQVASVWESSQHQILAETAQRLNQRLARQAS